MWQDRALCVDNPELWFSPDHRDRVEARQLCVLCKARDACTVEAQRARADGITLHGIWHGHDYGKGTGPLARPLRDDAEAAIEDPVVAS